MGTITVSNFAGGLDRTRPIYALENGRLWTGNNGHITRGGDFEKRKGFISILSGIELVNKTYGCLSDGVYKLYVYGSANILGYPVNVAMTNFDSGSIQINYVRLQNAAANMTKVRSADWFAGKQYVIADFDDGKTVHFYDGVIVSDWFTGGASLPTSTSQTAAMMTYKRKVYAALQSLLYFSAYDFPTYWFYGVTPTKPGAGFLNMSNNLTGNELITALAVYKSQLAVFSPNAIQLWSMDNNPTLNAPGQIITGTGTTAKKTVIGFGDKDVVYLSKSGIRSLQAIDYGGTATVQDLGTPIDALIQENIPMGYDIAERSCACVDPVDGRLWMNLAGVIYVYSYFPGKKIAAWTTYTGAGCTDITDMVVVGNRVVTRDSTGNMYAYGGTTGLEYDYEPATVQLPFMSMADASGYKQITGFDAALSGTWDVNLLFDPSDLTQKVSIGTVDAFTYNDPNIGAVGYGTHIAPSLVSSASPTAASLSAVSLHYLGGERDTGSKK